MNPTPPKLAERLLKWWCSSYYYEEVSGDIYEEFEKEYHRQGRSKANKLYWRTVLRSLRPYLRRNPLPEFNHGKPNSIDMIKNYFKIAVRSIISQKIYASINVFGLSVGLACCMLIGLFIAHEVSYDKFYKDADDIYRINVDYNWGGDQGVMAMTPTALLPTLQRDFPEVESGVRTFRVGMFSPLIVKNEDIKFEEKGFVYADSTFFDVFSLNLIEGDPKNALVKPNSIVLTESSAKKYFNDQNPIDKLLTVGATQEFIVTGVVEDLPDNSHFSFDMLGSFSSIPASKSEIWGSANYITYIKLNTQNVADVEVRLSEQVAETLKEWLDDGDVLSYRFEPIKDIHLKSVLDRELEPQGDIATIYIVGAIGLLILIIACVNYMNLSTARSMDRAREVGMRKVLGAVRKQLFYQFMGESVLITSLALLLALVWVNFLLPQFNVLVGKSFVYFDLLSPIFLLTSILIVVLVAIVSGAYPAIVLSGFRPAEVLKGSLKRTKSGGRLRKSLVVFQFVISILLILGTIVVYDQLQYMNSKTLGYSKENVLVIPIDRKIKENYLQIKNSLLRDKHVSNITFGSNSPAQIVGGYGFGVPELGANSEIGIRAITVDPDFIKTMNMELIAGSDYTKTDLTQATLGPDSLRTFSFIVNEALLDKLYLTPDNAIGMQAKIDGRHGTIKGVVKNFHFASLHHKIEPMAMFIEPWQFHHMLIRITGDDVSAILADLELKWKTLVPHRPFIYQFLDQEYDTLYRSEQKTATLFTIFSALAIFIACLGLFGLISFTAVQRAKEIGVRKVMGASVPGVVMLISKDYAKLVFISFLISVPIGYWIMSDWLTVFEYRVELGAYPFLIAMLASMLITFVTISYQAFKSALANPAEILKNND